MRLLHTKQLESGNFAIEEFTDYNTPPYAILSHTWHKDEVSFQDMEGDGARAKMKKGFEKIKDCCRFARANGFDYAWVDTCCIDKASSAELSEALNSMYRWYEEADICYAFLADISHTNEFKDCRWFDRGWTLQELIAPTELLFINKSWEELGSKRELRQAVSERTGIPERLLTGESDLDTFSVAQKMSWAAHRETSRTEDRAYSLMGLFGVHMPLLYGERETAFIRLQKEILQVSDDHTLFAWRDTDRRAGLLAPSPASFSESHDIISFNPFEARSAPPTVSSRGIFLELRFVGLGPDGLGLALLPCKRQGELEDKLVAIYVRDISMTMDQFERVWSGRFELVASGPRRFGPFPVRKICVQVGRMTRKGNQQGGKWDVCPDQDFNLDEVCSRAMNVSVPTPGGMWNIDQVWLALARGGSSLLEARDKSGRRPLFWAAMKGHQKLVNALLDRGAHIEGAPYGNVRMCDRPLVTAIASGHDATAELLIERGAEVKFPPDDGSSPLSLAAKHGRRAIVHLLLDRDADIEGNEYDDAHGVRPLTSAVENGDETIFEMLIKRGAEVETSNCEGRTPLTQAAKFGRENIATLLIEKGVSLEPKSSFHRTPLSLAAESGHAAIVKLLLEKGAAVERKDQKRRSPLLWAVQNEDEACSRLLLEAGASLETHNNFGLQPLHLAIEYGSESNVRLLLEKGASVENKAGPNGPTPLLLAVERGRLSIVKLLLERGAKTEMEDSPHPISLWWAVQNESAAMVKMLLENGAALEKRKRGISRFLAPGGNNSIPKYSIGKREIMLGEDDYNRTPLSLAKKKGLQAVVQLLLDAQKSR